MPGEHPQPSSQTQAQTQTQMLHPHPVHPVRDRDHEYEVKGLRVALGSILSPKRCPSSRASASSSGTASPAHFGPGLVHPYPYPHPHGHPHAHPQSHGHSYAPHEPSHLHTPAPEPEDQVPVPDTTNYGESAGAGRPVGRILRTVSESSQHSTGSHPELSGPDASQRQKEAQQLPTPPSEPVSSPGPTILTTSNVHSLTPAQAERVVKEKDQLKDREKSFFEQRGSGYIATLQSKHAWDALVHGNMS